MRLIDADALVEALNESGVPYRADVQEVLDAQPTVDAVPVVRCKDCKRFAPDKDGGDWGMCTDEGSMILTQKDFGCLGGERKEDDETGSKDGGLR